MCKNFLQVQTGEKEGEGTPYKHFYGRPGGASCHRAIPPGNPDPIIQRNSFSTEARERRKDEDSEIGGAQSGSCGVRSPGKGEQIDPTIPRSHDAASLLLLVRS
jgi:hypothetical protein